MQKFFKSSRVLVSLHWSFVFIKPHESKCESSHPYPYHPSQILSAFSRVGNKSYKTERKKQQRNGAMGESSLKSMNLRAIRELHSTEFKMTFAATE